MKIIKAIVKAVLDYLTSPAAWKWERPLLLGLGGAVVEAIRLAAGHP